MNQFLSTLSPSELLSFRQMQEVVPSLWIGGLLISKSWRSLSEHGVTHVVDASGHRGNSVPTTRQPGELQRCLVDVEDEDTVDLTSHFGRVSEFICRAIAGGGVVFVH